MRVLLSVLGVVAIANGKGSAAITDIRVTSFPSANGIVNRIWVDFTGQYTGSQLLLTLERDPSTNIALPEASPLRRKHVELEPDLADDSFVTQGGATLETSNGLASVGGGAINLSWETWNLISLVPRVVQSTGAPAWGSERLNQSWHTAPGHEIMDESGFLTAQITLSPDAVGTMRYLASADGDIALIYGIAEEDWGTNFGGRQDSQILDGFISLPEPADEESRHRVALRQRDESIKNL